MRPAEWFGHDFVGNAQFEQFCARHFQGRGCGLCLGRVFPQDRRAPLRGNDRVDRVLQHHDPVGYAQRQRPAASPFSRDDGHDRHPESGHGEQVSGNGPGLAALLGSDAGVGAWRIDKRDDRAFEFLGQLHQSQGFPIAFRIGHTEIPFHPFLETLSFFMTDDANGPAPERGKSTDDGLVVAEGAITVEFDKVFAHVLHIVQDRRALGMAGDLRLLPGGQVAEDVLLRLGQPALENADQPREGFPLGPRFLQLLQPFLEFFQRLFKFQKITHGRLASVKRDGFFPENLLHFIHQVRTRQHAQIRQRGALRVYLGIQMKVKGDRGRSRVTV